jgi:proline iminopeptidase
MGMKRMGKKLFGGYMPPYRDVNGEFVAGSISTMEKILLGGVEQWYTIRGRSEQLPLLIFFHGGPGSPQTGAQRKYNARLEEHYLVVNWDQRGSGKSFSTEVEAKTMTLDQLLSDANELIDYLLRKYNKKKVYIMGQSLGAVMGLTYIKRFPDKVHAYVGINQPVNRTEEEKKSYRFALESAKLQGNKKAIKQLEAIGFPENGVYQSMNDMVTQRKWLTKFNGVTHKKNANFINLNYFLSTHLTLKEKMTFMKGFGFSSTHLWEEMTSINLFHRVLEVEVPVYFVMGRHDKIVFLDEVERYFQLLKAPKKHLIVFEESGHLACFEEEDKFNELMTKQVLDNRSGNDNGY